MKPRVVCAGILGLVVILCGFSAPPALAAGKVVVYNADTAEFGEAFATAFNKQYPDIAVEIISAGVGQLFTRVKAEASRPQGDIMLAASHESFLQMADLFQPFTSKLDGDFAANLKDAQRRFYGFSMPLQVVVLNTSLAAPSVAPKSWKDLGDAKWKGKIIMANPALSGPPTPSLRRCCSFTAGRWWSRWSRTPPSRPPPSSPIRVWAPENSPWASRARRTSSG